MYSSLRRHWLIIVFLILASRPLVCFASGWNDYVLDIGDGYTIVKCNSLDICVGKTDNRLILCPENYDGVGPVALYFVHNEYIFTKNLGRKPRNLFDGDTFQIADTAQEYYFIIHKESENITGPLLLAEFMSHPSVSDSNSINWKIPRNPNFLLSAYGKLIFLGFTILMLVNKYLWISILIFAFSLVFVIRKRRKKRRENWADKVTKEH